MTGRSITAPVFTGTLNDKPLRFFSAPLAGPHLVWHAVDDLHACLRLPRDLRRHYRQSLQKDHAADVATVATADGILTIAPHWMAQGLIDAVQGFGSDAKTKSYYAMEATKAWEALDGHFPAADRVERMVAAFRNTNKIGEAP